MQLRSHFHFSSSWQVLAHSRCIDKTLKPREIQLNSISERCPCYSNDLIQNRRENTPGGTSDHQLAEYNVNVQSKRSSAEGKVIPEVLVLVLVSSSNTTRASHSLTRRELVWTLQATPVHTSDEPPWRRDSTADSRCFGSHQRTRTAFIQTQTFHSSQINTQTFTPNDTKQCRHACHPSLYKRVLHFLPLLFFFFFVLRVCWKHPAFT